MAPISKPFQLLEINVISAQDLEPVAKKMKTYATAWVNTKRKLSSRVDTSGHVNPTWNDKFVFRVDEDFLGQDTSAVQIEIYSVHWFKDTLVGSVRILVGNLIPPLLRSQRQNNHIGMRFVALQVRRPSGRPQGILNIGVTLLDSSMRSMPLYTQPCASAVGYRDLMGEDDSYLQNNTQNNSTENQTLNKNVNATNVKPILRRTKSERSERVTFDNNSMNGSVVAVPLKTKAALEMDNSIISISNEPFKGFPNKGKASSVISGAELREKKPKSRGRTGKGGSVLSDSMVSKGSSLVRPTIAKPLNAASDPKVGDKNKEANEKENGGSDNGIGQDPQANDKGVDDKYVTISKAIPPLREPPKMAIGKPIPKLNGYEYGGPRANGKYMYGAPYKANSIWSDSEVGPSPSEVAAAMAERKYPLDEERSSVLDGWSLDESVEGLRSKLERWRTELPPLYDDRGYASSSFQSTGHHRRRHTDGGTGMFSCFGNIFGYECQCICGQPPGRKSMSARYQSPSVGSRSFF